MPQITCSWYINDTRYEYATNLYSLDQAEINAFLITAINRMKAHAKDEENLKNEPQLKYHITP